MEVFEWCVIILLELSRSLDETGWYGGEGNVRSNQIVCWGRVWGL